MLVSEGAANQVCLGGRRRNRDADKVEENGLEKAEQVEKVEGCGDAATENELTAEA